MAMNLPHPKFLSSDELNYELQLRSREQDVQLEDDQKIEILRKLFQEDRNEKSQYRAPYLFDEEANFVNTKVTELLKSLEEQQQVDAKGRSKLRHYYYRLQRAETSDEKVEDVIKYLFKKVSDAIAQYTQQSQDEQTEQSGNETASGVDQATGGYKLKRTPVKDTGAIPKQTDISATNNSKKPDNTVPTLTEKKQVEGLKEVIDGYAKYIERLEKEAKRNKRQQEAEAKRSKELFDQQQSQIRNLTTQISKLQTNREQPPKRNQRKSRNNAAESSSSAEENPSNGRKTETGNLPPYLPNPYLSHQSQLNTHNTNIHHPIPQNPTPPNPTLRNQTLLNPNHNTQNPNQIQHQQHPNPSNQYQNQNPSNFNQNPYPPNQFPLSPFRLNPLPPYPQPPRPTSGSLYEETSDERHSRFGNRRGYHDRYRKIEHWKLSFSGEPKSMSIEDFLFKLKRVAVREGVSDASLLRHIHLILEGPASDWFFTYEDEFLIWDDFEQEIRARFGNPNQDQGLRQKINDRKQQRGETFAAFVTDIERLNKMLSKPLSERRKFEVIWDNMRSYYHTRLATINVTNLGQLKALNGGIDAADSRLQQQSDLRNQRHVHNVECELEEQSDDSVEMVEAIGTRPEGRGYKPQTGRSNYAEQNRSNQRNNNQQQQQHHHQPVEQPSRSNAVQQVEQQIRVDSAISQTNCWNCHRTGHNWRDCQEPRAIFCYGCGMLGRTIRSCPKCFASGGARSSLNQGNR